MTCHELAKRLSEWNPDLSQVEIARLSLMILSQTSDPSDLVQEDRLLSAWKHATFRMEAAADQHAAVAEELEALCDASPSPCSQEQLCVLLRAIKVQSQVLELYHDASMIPFSNES
jgi:hypothetical protein